MKNIVEILKSHFNVLQIVIENFTILDSNFVSTPFFLQLELDFSNLRY